MSSIMEPKSLSYKSSAAIAKGKAVTVDATGKIVTAANAVTDKSIGIAMGAATGADETIEVAHAGGGAKGLAGGSISAGDFVAPTTGGALIATTTGTNRPVGQAMEDAASGDLFAMIVAPFLI